MQRVGLGLPGPDPISIGYGFGPLDRDFSSSGSKCIRATGLTWTAVIKVKGPRNVGPHLCMSTDSHTPPEQQSNSQYLLRSSQDRRGSVRLQTVVVVVDWSPFSIACSPVKNFQTERLLGIFASYMCLVWIWILDVGNG